MIKMDKLVDKNNSLIKIMDLLTVWNLHYLELKEERKNFKYDEFMIYNQYLYRFLKLFSPINITWN